jgi:hypothetical protein
MTDAPAERSPTTATAVTPMTGSNAGAGTDEGGIAGDVRGVVEGALSAVGRAGTISAASVADAVEGAGRSLSRRVVSAALAERRSVSGREDLAHALAEKPTSSPLLASGTAAAMATRVVSRFGPLRFLARRTPMWLLAGAVPALIASVARGSDELALVASHLATRARAQGIEPDPERVRRVAVQVLSESEVDPEREPRHGALVVRWLRRAARAALPFTAGVATADPDGVASRAASVDPALLGRPALG